jgi:hypothetical protein
MSKRDVTRLGFDFIHGRRGNTVEAKFTCSRCSEVMILSVGNKSPGDIAALAESHGWAASATRKHDAICPKCLAKKAPNDPEAELTRFAALHLSDTNTQIPDPQPEDDQMRQPPTQAQAEAMASQIQASVASAVAKLIPPVPTTDQRVAIRNLLDKHFDDSIGRFLDGMSDRIIAEKVGLPAIVVKNIREAAYGPEKTDPELEGLAVAVARIEIELTQLKERLNKAMGKAA